MVVGSVVSTPGMTTSILGVELGPRTATTAVHEGEAVRVLDEGAASRGVPAVVAVDRDGGLVVGQRAATIGNVSPERVADLADAFATERLDLGGQRVESAVAIAAVIRTLVERFVTRPEAAGLAVERHRRSDDVTYLLVDVGDRHGDVAAVHGGGGVIEVLAQEGRLDPPDRWVTEAVESVIDASVLSPTDVDRVYLDGDGASMATLASRLESRYGALERLPGTNPFAGGVAVQAGVLMGTVSDVVLLGSIPWDLRVRTSDGELPATVDGTLGLEVAGGAFEPLIEADKTVPAEATKTFTTYEDRQESIEARVYWTPSAVDGEVPMPDDAALLGTHTYRSITPAPAGEPQRTVSLSIDVDGSVTVTVREANGDGESVVELGSVDLESPTNDGETVATAVEAHTTAPTEQSIELTTSADRPYGIAVELLADADTLGRVDLDDLPSRPAGNVPVEATVTVDDRFQPTLTVTADDDTARTLDVVDALAPSRETRSTLRDRLEAWMADGGGTGRTDPSSGADGGRSPADRRPETVPDAPSLDLDRDDIVVGEVVGRGGNARVRRGCVETPTGTETVALKEPTASGTLHASDVERFVEEAETWANLDDHDNVVGVVDWGSTPLPWLAVEFMDGGHLGDRVGEMDLGEALWTALGVVEGVKHAHGYGVVHLDLKSENVLFRTTADGTWDVPKVADWGLATRLLDRTDGVEGLSPHYGAPEQFDADRFGRPDRRTDVYQLGVVCYELFTGRRPVDETGSAAAYEAMAAPLDPPTAVDSTLPDELDEILLGCLRPEKADRYEDVLYLRDDLQSLLESLVT